MVTGKPLPDSVYEDAVGTKRGAIRHIYGKCFADYGLAAILCPTTAVVAPPIASCDTVQIGDETVDIFRALSRFTDPSSITGLPSVTVPAGMLTGMPFGVDLDGPYGSDSELLSVAAGVEAVLGRLPPPTALG